MKSGTRANFCEARTAGARERLRESFGAPLLMIRTSRNDGPAGRLSARLVVRVGRRALRAHGTFDVN